ncbi:hypothetical protein SAMN04489761_4679 [Tenacibaculum sp. MAR_2009_124]|uniref:hypothetical protein n=1 Tax=Tenacibaculum sp. MAR_2009_124 TaxID=1250059 RepID=UPI00089593DF|nr:hypothetical protein [Tenacibaculum sp. MAR_2009_124]SED22327.1 hypothetical protein SAMN04489761_4679 [Tenacibaculum sp. MAR_2009_124]
MAERIGKFLWKNNFSTFSLSYQRGKSDYFHTFHLTIKIILVLGVFIYFEMYNFGDFGDLILITFFTFLFFIFISQLLSIYIKPTNKIIEYIRPQDLFIIRINCFRSKTLKINEIELFIVDYRKEHVAGGNGHKNVYRYMCVAYCKDIYGNKHEMFVVNPIDVTKKSENEITYELTRTSKIICDKISFILDIKTEFNTFEQSTKVNNT